MNMLSSQEELKTPPKVKCHCNFVYAILYIFYIYQYFGLDFCSAICFSHCALTSDYIFKSNKLTNKKLKNTVLTHVGKKSQITNLTKPTVVNAVYLGILALQ